MPDRINSTKLKPYIVALLLFLNIISKLLFLFQPFERIDSTAIPDDTYISLDLAKNIASGNGPMNSTGFTNGFQPLYVFLCVPVYLLSGDDKIKAVYAALVMLLFFDCLCLLMLLKLISLFISNNPAKIIPAVFWITSSYVLLTSMNGLETIISFFFIVSTFYSFFKYRKIPSGNSGHKQLIITAVFCGLAVLSRTDNGILAAVILVYIISGGIINKKVNPETIKSAMMFSGIVLIIILPWLLYSYIYTGQVWQTSGEAVRYQNWSLENYFGLFSSGQAEMILYGLRIIFIKNISLILLSLICVTIILFKSKNTDVQSLKNKFLRIFPLILFCALLFCSYVFYIYGMWFFKRYFFPLVSMFILILAILIDTVLNSFNNSRLRNTFIFLVTLILLTINFTRYDYMQLYLPDYHNPDNAGYHAIGEWVSENFKEGTVIGAMQSGAITYFADNMKVVNLDGVVNKDALTAIKNKDLIEYVRSMKIEYIIGWEINNEYLIRESENFSRNNLTEIADVKDFETWDRKWFVYKVNY